ncbi:MAG: APC family permease, partial [Actinobacteria bacterium]|nr:APC family permease [Actinomycetota bacterium]
MSVDTASKPAGSVLKRILVGRAFTSHKLEHTLLPKSLALPVFASDALSSVAYATGEIFIALAIVSTDFKHLVMPIAIAIAALMAIVVASYRQTVRAYPMGGGAYRVAKENLGRVPGLVAAAALLVDYTMTVVVSIVAGVFAIGSALPAANEHRVILAIGFVWLVTIANLRGTKESGVLFAIPTYGFVASIMILIVVGLVRCLNGCPATEAVEPIHNAATTASAIGMFAILRAFSSGATALTGVEAIADGVPAFRRPQARNAAETLAIMGAIGITMFLGISWLATHIDGTVASEERSIPGQIAFAVFGGGLGFYVVQFFTAAILILAANTAYQDFPRLSSILARDRYMPSQFMNRGDRLVFSNGIVVLAAASSLLIYAFDADLTRLIQLYVIGVFTSFTLSQSGMVVRWLRLNKAGRAPRGWHRSITINVIGATVTGLVLVVVTLTKFTAGGWISMLFMAILFAMFSAVHRHYESVGRQLRRGSVRSGDYGVNHMVLVIRDLDAAAAEAIGVVRSIRPTELHILHPTDEPIPPELQERWRAFSMNAPPLEPLRPGKDNLLDAVKRYVRGIERAPEDFVNVVIPEVVQGSLLGYVLRRASLIRLKAGLLREPNIVVTDVPVVLEEGHPVGVDARPLIPERTVALVFVSAVHDATIRAVNYAETLEASETRAIYFDLDPEAAHRMQEEWAEAGPRIPLDIVEAPFRDLTRPTLEEVRRFSSRPGTLVLVVLPEFVVSRWR